MLYRTYNICGTKIYDNIKLKDVVYWIKIFMNFSIVEEAVKVTNVLFIRN